MGITSSVLKKLAINGNIINLVNCFFDFLSGYLDASLYTVPSIPNEQESHINNVNGFFAKIDKTDVAVKQKIIDIQPKGTSGFGHSTYEFMPSLRFSKYISSY